MIYKKYVKYLKIIAFSFVLIGCSTTEQQVHNNFSNKSYLVIQQKLKNRNWKQAIEDLELFNNLYPFSSFSKEAQLDLIYAYYKNSDFSLAKMTINRFIRLNPTYRNIDYVIYMRGLINMTLDRNMSDNFFGINSYEHDPQNAYSAFKDFSNLVENYPDSQYVADAIKRLIFLKNRLALYEYSIAVHYARKNAWVAVVNRVEGMLRNYSDTLATKNALKLMENAYRQMQMIAQAEKVSRIISIN